MRKPIDRLNARSKFVILELTTNCNLRCVYCTTSLPGFVGHDLALDEKDWVEQVARLHPREVQVSGHGETTMIEGWHKIVRQLLERGLTVSLTTNLARELAVEELEVLSHMVRITVSCDSADPEQYAALRRGGRLEQVESNIRQLFAFCEKRGQQAPYLAINAVVVAGSTEGLPALARWTSAIGANGISLVDLVEYAEPLGKAISVNHPAEVNPTAALRSIDEMRSVGQQVGLDVNLMPGLEARLAEALTKGD